MARRLHIHTERWPIAGAFTIARGSRTESIVVTAQIVDGGCSGKGEGYPLPRYNQTPEGVAAEIESCRTAIENGIGRAELSELLPANAARNALDCALWELEAKQAGRRVWELAGTPAPRRMTTAYTISLAAPDAMAAAAARAARPLLKIKLGGADGLDAARIAAIRLAVPKARLIVDANEGWRPEMLALGLAACAAAGVELVEQPLPASNDMALARIEHPMLICADESVHDRTLPREERPNEDGNVGSSPELTYCAARFNLHNWPFA